MTDADHMAHALVLGARGLGRAWPNPAVGCVIVRDGRILGRGWTQAGGRPHAEVRALDQAGDARGATAYVTLEPCAHHGQTPPCAQALIRAGLARVVTALTDPDPRTAGKGHAMLRAAGIEVCENVGKAEAARANQGFFKRVTLGLPALTLKLATTLDGRIATSTGQSRWITGPLARRHVHAMRLCHDAVLIGSGTARADDPDLTAREIGAAHQPVRILLDRSLAHGPDSRLGCSAQTSPVWVLHDAAASPQAISAWAATGARLIACPVMDGRLDLRAALEILGAQGLTRILCEGGGQIAAGLLRDGLVDDIVHIGAGRLIGADGIVAIGGLGITTLQDAPRLHLLHSRAIGPDTLSHWTLGQGLSSG